MSCLSNLACILVNVFFLFTEWWSCASYSRLASVLFRCARGVISNTRLLEDFRGSPPILQSFFICSVWLDSSESWFFHSWKPSKLHVSWFTSLSEVCGQYLWSHGLFLCRSKSHRITSAVQLESRMISGNGNNKRTICLHQTTSSSSVVTQTSWCALGDRGTYFNLYVNMNKTSQCSRTTFYISWTQWRKKKSLVICFAIVTDHHT